jgi:hypothetical protein
MFKKVAYRLGFHFFWQQKKRNKENCRLVFLNNQLRVVRYPDSYRDAQTRPADSNSARFIPPRRDRLLSLLVPVSK